MGCHKTRVVFYFYYAILSTTDVIPGKNQSGCRLALGLDFIVVSV